MCLCYVSPPLVTYLRECIHTTHTDYIKHAERRRTILTFITFVRSTCYILSPFLRKRRRRKNKVRDIEQTKHCCSFTTLNMWHSSLSLTSVFIFIAICRCWFECVSLDFRKHHRFIECVCVCARVNTLKSKRFYRGIPGNVYVEYVDG